MHVFWLIVRERSVLHQSPDFIINNAFANSDDYEYTEDPILMPAHIIKLLVDQQIDGPHRDLETDPNWRANLNVCGNVKVD